MQSEKKIKNDIKKLYHILVLGCTLLSVVIIVFILLMNNPTIFVHKPEEQQLLLDESDSENLIVDGVHVATGFVDGAGLTAVIQNCTNCHSAKLVTQNRMTKEGWIATIRWMQETQNLWDLGENEKTIVQYLATYYAPQKKGRREILTDIEWYELKE